jgi:hypothetical protein
MSTVSQLKDRIFRATNKLYDDQDHMLDLLNDGLNNLVDAGKLKAKVTITVLVNINSYPLPVNFKSTSKLQDETDPNAVLPYELVDISENRFGYAIESGFMYIKPMPTQAVTLTFYYYKYATPLVLDTDTPTDIDAPYHDLLATYAISQIIPLIKRDTSTRYAIMAANLADTRAWQMWEDGLKNFIDANTRKNKSGRVRDKVVW